MNTEQTSRNIFTQIMMKVRHKSDNSDINVNRTNRTTINDVNDNLTKEEPKALKELQEDKDLDIRKK